MSYTLESGTENSKVIFINSVDKNVSLDNDGSSFMYNLDTPVIAPDNQECLVSLYSCVIPYSFYNIRENVNDRIPFRLNNVLAIDITKICDVHGGIQRIKKLFSCFFMNIFTHIHT